VANASVLERSRQKRSEIARSDSLRSVKPNLPVVAVGVVVAVLVVMGTHPGNVQDLVDQLVGYLPKVLLLAILLPVLVAVAERPQRGVLILAALVPYNGLLIIAPAKPPFAAGWKEALALYTLVWAFASRVRKPRVKRQLPYAWKPLAAYLAVAIASAAIVGGVQGLVGIKVGFFWVLIGVAAWVAPLDARDRDRLVTILMVDAVITSLYGLYQEKIGAWRLVSMGYAWNTNVRFSGGFVRVISTFNNPFPFAFFLTFVLLIAVPICLDDTKRQRNVLFLAALPIILLALMFTFVRGAWLALGVGMLYLAVRKYRVLFLPVPLLLVAVLFLPVSFSSSAFGSNSFNERTLGWSQNASKVVSAPLGNGISSTGASAEKTAQVEKNTTAVIYTPDNQYFKTLYELGVIGLWFFIFMFISIVFVSRRAERRVATADIPLAMGYTAHVLGAIVAAIVSTWMEIFPNDFYLWLMLAVVVTATHESS
jgi:hypothetical protein